MKEDKLERALLSLTNPPAIQMLKAPACLAFHFPHQPAVVRTRMSGTSGSVFDPTFIAKIKSFYNVDTGTELMGPLVYSLFRSIRPKVAVELGAGYTTFWLAQAAMDASSEVHHRSGRIWRG